MENTVKVANKPHHKKNATEYAAKYPKHIQDLWFIFNNNAEIRRYCSNAILNYLKQTGKIADNAVKKYVDFKPNKFAITIDGLRTEYKYTEPFFTTCYMASFISFSAAAQNKLNAYLKAEAGFGVDKAVNNEDIQDMVKLINNSETLKEVEE